MAVRTGAGDNVGFIHFDEMLKVDDLDGTAGAIAKSVDVLYLAGHGACAHGRFQAILYDRDWEPARSGLGDERPVVVIFDMCDLVDLKRDGWQVPWMGASVGLGLRLLLGFSSLATVTAASSLRGSAFAEELSAGEPIADAWLAAVDNTVSPGLDVAIAIGLGDDEADANSVLNTATLANLPGPRAQHSPALAYKVAR
jgi:hypothetical protein